MSEGLKGIIASLDKPPLNNYDLEMVGSDPKVWKFPPEALNISAVENSEKNNSNSQREKGTSSKDSVLEGSAQPNHHNMSL